MQGQPSPEALEAPNRNSHQDIGIVRLKGCLPRFVYPFVLPEWNKEKDHKVTSLTPVRSTWAPVRSAPQSQAATEGRCAQHGAAIREPNAPGAAHAPEPLTSKLRLAAPVAPPRQCRKIHATKVDRIAVEPTASSRPASPRVSAPVSSSGARSCNHTNTAKSSTSIQGKASTCAPKRCRNY